MDTGTPVSGGNGSWVRGSIEVERSDARAAAHSRTGNNHGQLESVEGEAGSTDGTCPARRFKRERDEGTTQPDTTISLSDHAHGQARIRRRTPGLSNTETPTQLYLSTSQAPTMAALFYTGGQLPLTTNEEATLHLLNAGITDQGFLSQPVAPAELINGLGHQGVGVVGEPILLVTGGQITQMQPMDGYSSSRGTFIPTSFPLAMNLLDSTSAILQRRQLPALPVGSPPFLDYDYATAGLMLPTTGRGAPVIQVPTQQLGSRTTDFDPSDISSFASLADGESRVLTHVARTVEESRSRRNGGVSNSHAHLRTSLPPLPPCEDGPLEHHSKRPIVPLSTDEDDNWLSEFLCFVRSDLTEVFRAGREDVVSRINSKKISYGQIGIRCRFCAHLRHSGRASRSSSFPSSVSRIYQSLTMMLRDHFPRCTAIPEEKKNKFLALKANTTQGATDSKRYWLDSAMKLGMVDTPHGIMVTERTQLAARSAPPFGTGHDAASVAGLPSRHNDCRGVETGPPMLLVESEDKELVSEYLFLLLSQVQRVFLTESERVGNRKNLEVGLPGLGCRHCCPTSRKGLCRLFPARRRTLPSKVKDLHDHLRRCTLCPDEIKKKLSTLKLESEESIVDNERLKYFFDRVWARLHNEAGSFSDRRKAFDTAG